jgi:hypothetical protein
MCVIRLDSHVDFWPGADCVPKKQEQPQHSPRRSDSSLEYIAPLELIWTRELHDLDDIAGVRLVPMGSFILLFLRVSRHYKCIETINETISTMRTFYYGVLYTPSVLYYLSS